MASPKWQALVLNALRFEAGWLLCVLGGSWVAAIAGGSLLAWHLWRCARPGEWQFIAGFALLGLVIDGGFQLLGGFDFNDQTLVLGLLPLWLWMLWPLCGAISGPLSYYGGALLAEVTLAAWLLPVQALVWAVLCVGISRFYRA